MKAVDAAYPLYGAGATRSRRAPLQAALAEHDGVFGAFADPTLMARLDLKPGARLAVGNANFEVRAALASEPDKLAGGIGFGPRLMISDAGIARHRPVATRQSGALALPAAACRQSGASDSAAKTVTAQAREHFPQAGWDIRTRSNASPQLEREVERFTQFLTIVGLTALLVGGVGVGNAVKSHLDRKREVIATMKALGASGSPRLRHLSDAGDAARADRRRHRRRARRAAAVCGCLGLRRDHPTADRAGAACRRTGAGAALRAAHRARLCALAARPRA